ATGDDGGAADVDEVIPSRRDRLVLATEGFVPEHSLDLGCRIADPDAAIGAAKLVDRCGLHVSATACDREHHQRSNGGIVGRLRHWARRWCRAPSRPRIRNTVQRFQLGKATSPCARTCRRPSASVMLAI